MGILNFYKKICNAKERKKFLSIAQVDPVTLKLMSSAKCHILNREASIRIGAHCTVGALFEVGFGGEIQVGSNTYIGPGSILQSKEKIIIGNNVIVANNVLIVDNNNHPTDPAARLKMSQCNDFLNDELWSWKYAESAPIVIEDNVWIGRDSRIMKGVTVGKGSIVALGAIVTKDVPPYTIVAGNPAKVVKHLFAPEANI